MSSVHSENLAEQVAQLDQFFAEYNSEAMQSSGVELDLNLFSLYWINYQLWNKNT